MKRIFGKAIDRPLSASAVLFLSLLSPWVVNLTYVETSRAQAICAKQSKAILNSIVDHLSEAAKERNFEHYASQMDASMQEKISKIVPWVDVSKSQNSVLVDVGTGSGTLASHLAEIYPQSKVMGVDLSPEMIKIAKNKYQKPNLEFVLGAANKPFAKGADYAIYSSILHEVYSYSDHPFEALTGALTKANQSLKEGGRVIIRDFVAPENGDRLVLLTQLKSDIREGHSFTDFLGQFRNKFREIGRNSEKVSESEVSITYKTDLQTAYEYLFRKDYHTNWNSELNEKYGFWTEWQAKHLLKNSGFEIVESKTFTNPWIESNRLKDKIYLTDPVTNKPIEYPQYQILLVGEKVKKESIAKQLENSAAEALEWSKGTNDSKLLEYSKINKTKKLFKPLQAGQENTGIPVFLKVKTTFGKKIKVETVDGFLLADNGLQIHVLNTQGKIKILNSSDILRGWTKDLKNKTQWKHVESEHILKEINDPTKDYFAGILLGSLIEDWGVYRFAKTFELDHPTTAHFISGKIKKVVRNGQVLLEITDKSGLKHSINPDALQVDIFKHSDFFISSTPKAKKSGDQLPKLISELPASALPVEIQVPSKWTKKSGTSRIVEQILPKLLQQKNNLGLKQFFENFVGVSDLPKFFRKLGETQGKQLGSEVNFLNLNPVLSSAQNEEKVFLLTPDGLELVADGTPLWALDGRYFLKNSNISYDSRAGLTFYGVRPPGFHQFGDAIYYMDKGLSAVVPENAYNQFIKGAKKFGRPDGQFMTTKREMDLIFQEAKNDPDTIVDALGMMPLNGQKLIRIDLDNPWGFNPRLPLPNLSGANSYFLEGGLTSGGLHEIVVDQIPRDSKYYIESVVSK